MAKKKAKTTRRRTKARAAKRPLAVEATTHRSAKRLNIPTAEHESLVGDDDRAPVPVRYPRNTDLDPQLVWRGKDDQDASDLVVPASPLYIQEKVQPKALVDDLWRESSVRRKEGDAPERQPSLFADFNGLPDGAEKTEFYRHRNNWSNRMILGDSLRVMASLAERERLRGAVQCIYLDPPYGIKFNSNFQWSTTSRVADDDKTEHITREPEQVKAFRDTWRDGIHSYLTYLRDRLTAARDLLTESGSIFVQIGDENVHRVRAVMDEVFGPENFCALIPFQKTAGGSTKFIRADLDYLLWYGREILSLKYRPMQVPKDFSELKSYKYETDDVFLNVRPLRKDGGLTVPEENLIQISFLGSGDPGRPEDRLYSFEGKEFDVKAHRHWKTSNPKGLDRLACASRIHAVGTQLNYKRRAGDSYYTDAGVLWTDVGSAGFNTMDPKVYVVQTDVTVIQRCILMTTDPGDLVLDPTCGAGTTAYVAEQWGRRWLTIDTSRVALALARARIMGARYPYYVLADSDEGQRAEARLSGVASRRGAVHGDIRQGFVHRRAPHITLKAIANNTEIDAIWKQRQPAVEGALAALNQALSGHRVPLPIARGARKRQVVDFVGPACATVPLANGDPAPAHGLLEWEVPCEAPEDWPRAAKTALATFWEARLTRQKEIDESIAQKVDQKLLYDQPVEDDSKVRVAGPFTVESLSPYRTLAVDEQDELILRAAEPRAPYGAGEFGDFATMILEHLRSAGVQQPRKKDRIEFTSVTPWPGRHLAAEARWVEGKGGRERRAGVLIGPEFGAVSRPDLVDAAREAVETGFDAVVSCAFAYDAHSADLAKLGPVRILKARMNADLHMAGDLKNTGKGNLFVIFGEPDIEIEPVSGGDGDTDGKASRNLVRVRLSGVDVFHPRTGEIRSDDPKDIACWFLDTEYDGESFFVRHAYFPGASSDPYKALKTTLKAEIDEEAWQSLRREVSRPFPKPPSGRIAVKVINHLGDEVMKVFRVQ